MKSVDTLIIGAGLAGLSASERLSNAGVASLVLERETKSGGLARSFRIEGFSFDCSGHLLHIQNAHLRKRIISASPAAEWLHIDRKSHVLIDDRLVRYPFQANLSDAPPEVRQECLEALPAPSQAAHSPSSLGDWVTCNLGDGIARWFMRPYNEKLFGVVIDELIPNALGRFLPKVDREQIIAGAMGQGGPARGYNAKFLYPRRGGIDLLVEYLTPRAGPILTNQLVNTVNFAERIVETSDGSAFAYRDRLLTSMPLPLAARACGIEAGRELRARAVTCVNIGFQKQSTRFDDSHWVYLPEPSYNAYRFGLYSNLCRESAPANFASAYVEIAHWGTLSDTDALEQAINDLMQLELIQTDGDVALTHVHQIPQAYVVMDGNYISARKTCLDALHSRGIMPIGRYGRWEYGGMEDAINQGRSAADTILAERKVGPHF